MDYFHQKINYMFSDTHFKMGRCPAGTGSYRMHWHNCVELIYGYENTYTVTIGKQDFILSKGDIILIPGRLMHGFHMENQEHPLYFIQFKITPIYFGGDILPSPKTIPSSEPLIDNITIISKQHDKELHSLLRQTLHKLIEDMNVCEKGYRYMAISRLYEIAGLLKKYGMSDKYNKQIMNNLELKNISNSFSYIENNYLKNISINDVAESCSLNAKYFGRLFYKATGTYFNDYINELRIKKASKMLQENPDNITNVAYDCGFESISTFYRHFNKIHGCSPKQFISNYKL